VLLLNLWDTVKPNVIQLHNPLRKDRAALTKTWTKPYGIKLPTFPAIMRPNGVEGCLLSHAAIASKLTAPYIVLEDDAVPTDAANVSTELITSIQQCMANNVYDIIYLGGMPLDSATTRFPGIYEGPCLTTYAMIVGPRAASFLRTLTFTGTPVDVELSKAQLKFAFVDPPLFRQAITPSEIGKSSFTKSLFFAQLLGFATPWWRYLVIHKYASFFCLLVFIIVVIRIV
jgi:hypothetical protein